MRSFWSDASVRRSRVAVALLAATVAGVSLTAPAAAGAATVPASSATAGAASPLWWSTYWNNTSLSGPTVLRQMQAQVGFDTSGVVAPGVNTTGWSAEFTSSPRFAAGSYTFTLRVDDGARLWVGGKLVIDQWIPEAATTYTATVALSAGSHQVRLEYFQDTWAEVLNLSWAAVSTPAVSVPAVSVAPVITGPAQVASALSASSGTWANSPTGFGYQWRRDGVGVAGATNPGYVPVAGDVGHRLDVVVTASNPAGSATAVSAATAAVSAAPVGPPTGTFLRPFSADSLWYRPVSAAIAAGAYYGSGDGSRNSPGITVPANGIDVDYEWILQGSNAYPASTLWTTFSWPAATSGGSSTAKVVHVDPNLNIPVDSGSSGVNAAGAYLSPDGSTWYEGNAIAKAPGSNLYFGDVYADQANNGRGTYGGRGASGLSSVGGSLRPGELEGSAPIGHALKFTAPMAYYGRNTAGGYVTPALSADGGYNDASNGNYYGGNAFAMGALLAISPADLPAALAAMKTVQGRNAVNALATYGGYVAENSATPPGSGWELWMYEMDHAAVATSGIGTGPNPVRTDLANLLPYLHVVVNNNPPT